jgi:hypothetical protein
MTFFILVFFTFLVRLVYFIEVPSLDSLGVFYQSSFFTWDGLLAFYKWSPRLYLFLSTLFWLFFATYFKYVIISEKLIGKKSFIPAMSFILFASALPSFVLVSVQSLSAVLLFIAFAQAIRTQYNLKSATHYFIIGLMVGGSALLYWPSALFFLAIVWFLLSMRIFVMQEYVSLLLGFLLPLYLFGTLYYIFVGAFFWNKLSTLPLMFPTSLSSNWSVIVLSILCIFILLYGLFLAKRGITDNKLLITKKWSAVTVYFIIGSIIGAVSMVFPSVSWIYSIIPFSIILSSALSNNLKKYNTFTFYLVMLAVLGVQWLIRFL